MRNCAASNLSLSTSILASLTPLSAYPAATFSRIGESCLHGPHHSAQKSSTTSEVIDGWMTSASNRSIDSRSASLRPTVAKFVRFLRDVLRAAIWAAAVEATSAACVDRFTAVLL